MFEKVPFMNQNKRTTTKVKKFKIFLKISKNFKKFKKNCNGFDYTDRDVVPDAKDCVREFVLH